MCVAEGSVFQINDTGVVSTLWGGDTRWIGIRGRYVGGNNYNATVPPETTDNLSKGYTVNSVWYVKDSKMFYYCQRSNTETAQWKYKATYTS